MLPTANRLTLKASFENVKENGKFVSFRNFTIGIVNRNDSGESRFGFIVSKKISMKANVRNRIKRILREIVRKNLSEVKKGFDFVIIVKPGVIHAPHDILDAELVKCLKEI